MRSVKLKSRIPAKSLLKACPGLAILTLLAACSPPTPIAQVMTPDEIARQINRSGDGITLVHLWATWCQPCREEFPELLHFYRDHQDNGLNLVLVSADDPADQDAVIAFLNEHESPVGSLITSELSERFIELFSKKWTGALPATFILDSKGNLVNEWEGKRTYEHYVESINPLL